MATTGRRPVRANRCHWPARADGWMVFKVGTPPPATNTVLRYSVASDCIHSRTTACADNSAIQASMTAW